MLANLQAPCDENVIRLGRAAAPCAKARAGGVLAATILASSMAFIDGTVVNVALPALQATLNATAADLQWVVEAYSLLLSAFLLVGGALGDQYGRRRIFVFGVTVFALASAGCGLAQTAHQLILLRGIQGLGAALLVPGSLAIISSSFPENERGRAIGTWSGFSAITTALGPVLGGWLIQHASWRAVFFINVPIACVVIFLSFRCVTESAEEKRARIDWLGGVTAALALGSLVYGLIEWSNSAADHTTSFAFIGLGMLGLLFFIAIEMRVSRPMLPLPLFRSLTFTGTNLITLLLYAALGGTFFFLPLNLIQVQHYSPTATGAAMLPFIIIMSVLSRWSGALVTRVGPRLPLIAGPAIATVGYLLFIRPEMNANYWTNFFPAVTVLGLGMAVTVAPLTTTVMMSVAEERAGTASGVNNAVARTAGLLAIAVLGLVMLGVFSRQLDRRLNDLKIPEAVAQSVRAQTNKLAAIQIPPETDVREQKEIRSSVDRSFVAGFRMVMAIAAVLAAAGAFSAALFIRPAKTRQT